jgi:hypothetical protein
MNLKEIGWQGVGWIYVSQNMDRRRGSREHGNEFSGSINGGDILKQARDY